MSEPVLDAHRLRQFVCVAGHLNVTRAAAELNLTQQAVSSTIKTLERDLGVALFARSGRTIVLTVAGHALYDGAQPLLDAGAALVRSTRSAGHGAREHLVIAHTPAISSDEVFDLTTSIRLTHPDASITVRQCFPDEIVPSLCNGTIDVGLRRGATTPRNVAAAVIAYTPLRIAVATGHRLAHRDSISLSELKHEHLMLWGPPGQSFYADFLLSACRRAGIEPTITVNRIQGTAPPPPSSTPNTSRSSPPNQAATTTSRSRSSPSPMTHRWPQCKRYGCGIPDPHSDKHCSTPTAFTTFHEVPMNCKYDGRPRRQHYAKLPLRGDCIVARQAKLPRAFARRLAVPAQGRRRPYVCCSTAWWPKYLMT